MDPFITCGECEFGDENLLTMIDHILKTHPNYTPEEAEHYAQVWQQDAQEREDLDQIERTEYFKRHGVDPHDIDRDPL